jgi:AraC family transcriptional regulator of adaptative response / DNA-3-methyladenine glycosylase II
VAGARTVAAKLVAAAGERLLLDDPELTHVFPAAETVAGVADEAFAMPTARRATLRGLASAVADGTVVLDPGVDPDLARSSLLALKGIGPWTADYVVMRGLSHPDVFLGSDLGVLHAIDRIATSRPDPTSWAPWRSYAVHHLWADLSSAAAAPVPPASAPDRVPAARSARKETSP